jgi:hypothetical protein
MNCGIGGVLADLGEPASATHEGGAAALCSPATVRLWD